RPHEHGCPCPTAAHHRRAAWRRAHVIAHRREQIGHGLGVRAQTATRKAASEDLDVTLSVGGSMSSYVLVHGAWHGGWCWQRATPLLEREGHTVHTPTLTGLAERAAELTPAVGLEDHVRECWTPS